MTWINIVTLIAYTLNIIFAMIVIFASRKAPSSTWAWLFVLFFLPIIGFFLYIFLGRNLHKKNFVRWKMMQQDQTITVFNEQQQALRDETFQFPNHITKNYKRLVQMNVDLNHAILSNHNETTLYATGDEKFKALLADIEQATKHIHIQYYIFKLDIIGEQIHQAIIKKAKEGVKVRVIFDDLGSRKLKIKHFKQLLDAGGEVQAYFPSLFALLNPRINFRNHRKLVIIDGVIGYIGGFNVGKEYAGLDEKVGFWRDLHVRIVGNAVHSLQAHFLFDWHQAANTEYNEYDDAYYPQANVQNITPIQIVSSGPDTDYESIKESYIRMIMSARKYIYIQTPYFVPDAAFLTAIQIAAASGVEVKVMTPAKPDHMFIYGANSYYTGELMEHGGTALRYTKGFLHSKMMVIDDEICTIGTTNIDIRSFSLNFEINAVIYDEQVAKQCRAIFEEDEQYAFEMTTERYEKRPLWTKIREAFSRLISPIL